MTRDEVVARIKEGLGFRSDLDNVIIERLKEVQRTMELAPELPWFLVSEYTYINATVGEERIALPSNYIRGVEDDALWLYDEDASLDEDVWTALEKSDVETLRKKFPGSGAPCAYAEIGLYFRIFPTPDDTYQLRHLFYAKDTVLSSNIENKWLKYVPNLFIAKAGSLVAADIENADALAKFSNMEARETLIFTNFSEAQQHANQRYIIGDPD